MAKDPAFLFYSADFLIGTSLLTHEETGQYIRMLCWMHQHGRMEEKEIITIVGPISERLRSKFKIDDKGFLFNERFEKESEKRKKYTESRRENIKKRYDKATCVATHEPTYVDTHVVHMNLHMENENRNINKEDIKPLQNKLPILQQLLNLWTDCNKKYKVDIVLDMSALRQIAVFITGQNGIEHLSEADARNLLHTFKQWCTHIMGSTQFQFKSLDNIARFSKQEIHNQLNGNYTAGKTDKPAESNPNYRYKKLN